MGWKCKSIELRRWADGHTRDPGSDGMRAYPAPGYSRVPELCSQTLLGPNMHDAGIGASTEKFVERLAGWTRFGLGGSCGAFRADRSHEQNAWLHVA